MTPWLRRWKGRLSLALQSDVAFIENAFREILGRAVDADGLAHYRRALSEGLGRTAVLLDIARSDEFKSKLFSDARSLPNLMARRPDRYMLAIDRSNGQSVVVFDAALPSDFDWLEQQILDNKYYEAPVSGCLVSMPTSGSSRRSRHSRPPGRSNWVVPRAR